MKSSIRAGDFPMLMVVISDVRTRNHYFRPKRMILSEYLWINGWLWFMDIQDSLSFTLWRSSVLWIFVTVVHLIAGRYL
jgi:general stress protein CsbA